MKTLNKALTAWIDSMRIDPERLVKAVMDNGVIRPVEPVKAALMHCPMCDGSDGFFIPSDHAWSCLNSDCIRSNCINTPRQWYDTPQPTIVDCGAPKSFSDSSFKGMLEHQSEEVIQTLKAFVESIFAGKSDRFLLLAGNSGRGKTYASCACMKSYLDHPVTDARFINLGDLYMAWRNAWDNGSELNALLSRFREIGLLVLDDLGTRCPTDGFLNFIYMLINARDNANQGTIISTNLTAKEIIAQFGNAIYSRIASGKIIRMEGQDKRLSHGRT